MSRQPPRRERSALRSRIFFLCSLTCCRGANRGSVSRGRVRVEYYRRPQHRTEELLTASTRQRALSHAGARSRLGISKLVLAAPRTGGRFERCGIQRHHDPDERLIPGGTPREMPLPPEVGEGRLPGTRIHARTLPQNARGDPEVGAYRLARSYSRPGWLSLPDPAGPASVGPPPSKPTRRQGDR